MDPTQTAIKAVEDYFSAIEPWISVYRAASLSYFGVCEGDLVRVCSARIRLSALPGKPVHFRTKAFAAGRLPVSQLRCSAAEVAKKIVNEELLEVGSNTRLHLPRSENSRIYATPPNFLHPAGLETGRRLGLLTILGDEIPSGLTNPDLDWRLKASIPPYDGIRELLRSVGLDDQLGGRCSLEIVAETAIEVLNDSLVAGTMASTGVWIPGRFAKRGASLNYRVLDKQDVVDRGAVKHSQMTWTTEHGVSRGRCEIAVPKAAIVNCIAVYGDRAHHSYWFGDPKQSQNPRLIAFQAVDPGLQLLRNYALPSQFKSGTQHHFESAVAWLLWASGLSVAQTDRADQAKDGPDVLAVAPNGGQVVVECTLGLLKAENKLAKLSRRAISIRERLAESGFPSTLVLPVIVSVLSRREIAVELDAATDAGVLVFAKEDIERGLNEILLFPDGNAVFQRGIQALNSAVEELRKRRAPNV